MAFSLGVGGMVPLLDIIHLHVYNLELFLLLTVIHDLQSCRIAPKGSHHLEGRLLKGTVFHHSKMFPFPLSWPLSLRTSGSFYFIFYLFLFLLSIYSHVRTLFGSFLPPASHLPPPVAPLPPHFQAEPVRSLSLILLKRRPKHNKEVKALLLVELRIAIQRDS
jgi:hypothetical protein